MNFFKLLAALLLSIYLLAACGGDNHEHAGDSADKEHAGEEAEKAEHAGDEAEKKEHGGEDAEHAGKKLNTQVMQLKKNNLPYKWTC